MKYAGINYTDGEKVEGKTYQRVEDRYSAWQVKHDNREVQNDETVDKKVMTSEETYNQIQTLTSLDLHATILHHRPGRDRRLWRVRNQHHSRRGRTPRLRPTSMTRRSARSSWKTRCVSSTLARSTATTMTMTAS